MKIKYQFRGVQASEHLKNYFEDRLQKVEKFELKPVNGKVLFSMKRHEVFMEVTLTGLEGGAFKAKSKSKDFYKASDQIVSKLMSQFAKKKNRMQKHKNYQKSAQGRLNKTNSQLEAEYLKAG